MKFRQFSWGEHSGFIYIVHIYHDVYKIGMTKRLDQRLIEIDNSSHFNTDLFIAIGTNKYKELEKEIHYTFANKKIKGEFFRLSISDLEWLVEDAGAMGCYVKVNSEMYINKLIDTLPYARFELLND